MRRRALWLLALAAAVLTVSAAWKSPALAVRRIRVTGLAALTPAEAQSTIRAAALPPHTSWVRAPVRELEAHLRRLPWVADARVYRRFPPRLVVVVVPRAPVATLTVGAERWQIDAEGVLVRPVVSPGNLPEVVSPGGFGLAAGRPVVDANVLAALPIVAPEQGARRLPVSKIEVDPHGELCLNMTDTIAIRLGQADDLSTKLALVRRIYSEEPRIADTVEQIDLRCPEAPACIPRAATKPSPREAAVPPTQARSADRAGASSRESGRPNEPSRQRPDP